MIKYPFPKWSILDVIFLFVLYNVLTFGCVTAVMSVSGVNNEGTTPVHNTPAGNTVENKDEKKESEHPLTQLIQQSKSNPAVLLIAMLIGVIVTPVVEEFLFRLILQNGILSIVKYGGKSSVSAEIQAVFITSLFFASLHGLPRKEISFEVLQASMTGAIIGGILFLIAGIAYLTIVRKTEAKDLGWDKRFLFSDILTAVKYAVFVIPAVMLLHIAVKLLFPNGLIPHGTTDPIPLFFFSLVLGSLFYRHRRLAPCVFLHALFNGFNFALLLFTGG